MSFSKLIGFVLLSISSFSYANDVPYFDPNSFSGFGGQNKSGFEKLTCQQIITSANKNTFERSKKMIDNAGLTLENCKPSKLAQIGRAAAMLTGFSGFESTCEKKLSFILRKLKVESEDLQKILKIRMALYDVRYIYGKSTKANDWFSKYNCDKEHRANSFLPLALKGRPLKPNNSTDSDKVLIEGLAGRCEAREAGTGSAIPTFTVVANELYGNQGLNTVANDRAICQKVIDDYRLAQIPPRQQVDNSSSGERKASECPPIKHDSVCQDILLTNSTVTGDICKFNQFERCLLEPASHGPRTEPEIKSTAGDLK